MSGVGVNWARTGRSTPQHQAPKSSGERKQWTDRPRPMTPSEIMDYEYQLKVRRDKQTVNPRPRTRSRSQPRPRPRPDPEPVVPDWDAVEVQPPIRRPPLRTARDRREVVRSPPRSTRTHTHVEPPTRHIEQQQQLLRDQEREEERRRGIQADIEYHRDQELRRQQQLLRDQERER